MSAVRRGLVAFVATSFAITSTAASPAPASSAAIDVGGYLRSHSEDFLFMPDHPQVACLLKAMMTEEEISTLRGRMHRMQGSAWLETLDEEGGYLFEGWVAHGADCERGLLWLHPDGRAFVATWKDCERLAGFANDDALATVPPVAIRRALASIRSEWATWPASTPVKLRVHGLPASCSASRQARVMGLQEERRAGRLCDAETTFGEDGAVAVPRNGSWAPLLRDRSRCGVASPRRRPWVVAGDLLLTAQSMDGCTCAAFDGPKGRTAGWISDADRVVVRKDAWDDARQSAIPELEPKALAAVREALPPTGDFVGRWRSRDARIDIGRDAAGFTILADASWGYHVAGLRGRVAVHGRLGTYTDEANPAACRLQLLLLNDALLVVDDVQCGGYGVSFTGHYALDSDAEPVVLEGD